ncbi:MAG: GDP-mannose 4,6-dehydratase [Chloroflexi bacterium]|nr:GDP-mannose 4,6-dehydratase [Chloroflexota bacterium]
MLGLLATKGAEYDIHGVVREGTSLEQIKDNLKSVNLVDYDLVNLTTILRLVKEAAPDRVYHLAGESSVKLSCGGTLSMVISSM